MKPSSIFAILAKELISHIVKNVNPYTIRITKTLIQKVGRNDEQSIEKNAVLGTKSFCWSFLKPKHVLIAANQIRLYWILIM